MRPRFHVLAIHWRKGMTSYTFRSRYLSTQMANSYRRDGFIVLQWGN
jgi:hypothetical protein